MKSKFSNIIKVFLSMPFTSYFLCFLKNKRGAVVIEFFFMILLLLIMFAFMADLVLIRTTQGKLDNVSYSLVNVLRERTLFYNQRQELNTDDARQIKQLAAFLLYGDKYRENDIDVTVEFWRPRVGNHYLILGDKSTCSPYIALNEQSMLTLSPNAEDDVAQKVPTYQVTLCMNVSSLFKRLVLDPSSRLNNSIRSSSWSVGL